MKKLLSVLLVLALALSLSCVAFAADGDAPDAGETPAAGATPVAATTYDLSAAKLTKELTVADGINIDAVKKFTFSFTAVGSDTAAVADHPTIAAQEVTVGAQSNGKATGELALSNVLAGFNHAGEYVYTVAETTTAINTNENGVTKTLTVDDTTYTVRVYVQNNDAGTAVEIAGITVENNKTKEKVDPTSSGFIFKNVYKEVIASDDGVLTVKKSITGDYADKTKEFAISVVLTLPSTATADDVAVATGTTWTASSLTASANLADGGEIKFTKLPAGTTFVVKEDQDTLYRSKTTGHVETEDTNYTQAGADVEKTGKVITAAGSTVTIENNREDVIPTGVIIHNLPYVLLVLVAIAGLVYLIMKKRAYNA